MKKSQSISYLVAGMLLPAVISQAKPTKNATSKPNVIYIYFDDLGYGDWGCYGQQKIKTPNIDRLAGQGIRFTHHYSAFPISAPARCALMTGKHAGHSFIRDNYEYGGFTDETERGQMPIPEGVETIASLMKESGYVTGAIGKWGLGFWDTSGNPNRQGFDYFYGYICQTQAHNYYPTHLWENGRYVELDNKPYVLNKEISKTSPDSVFDRLKGNEYAIDKMAEKTMSFIKENKDKPFFLYLPYTTPHLPLQAPEAAVNQYVGQLDETMYYGDWGYAPSKYPYSTYAAMITYTDKIIGDIMKWLADLHLDENTLVMISSDNGCSWRWGGYDPAFFNSTAGMRGNKTDLYEGGIRIPFVAYWPGKIPGGSVTDLLSAQYDLFNTLAELTGNKAKHTTDGISFLPTLLGNNKKQQKHEYLYFEFGMKNGQAAIVTNTWKGIKLDLKKDNPYWEIYNLETDVKENNNLVETQSDLVSRFEKIIQKEHWRPVIKNWEFINN